MSMKTLLRRMAVVPILATAVLGSASGTADAAPAAYTCTGGPVPAGTYASLSITGDCYIDAAVTVNGNMSVGPTSAARLLAYPVPTARLTVKGSLSADGAGNLGLGCYRANLCGGSTTVTVAGSMSISRTTRLQLDYVAVGGNLTVTGTAGTCDDSPDLSIQIYTSTIGGNLSVTGNTACLMKVGGNTIKGSLACTGNTPAITLPAPNVVKGRTTGQCLVPATGS